MTRLRPLARDERGFTMFTVMLVMLVCGLFVVSGFAAANGDLPLGLQSQDSKQAYAAAEAGVNYYASQLAANPDYWTACNGVAPPNASEPSPVTTEWYGTGTDTRTGHWRSVPGTNGSYSVELLAAKDPAAGNLTPQCTAGDQASFLDPSTGVFRIRSTGRAGKESRSLIASFRRPSFLDYLWFTNFENLDPAVATSDQTWQALHCADYRPARNAAAGGGHSCSEITFPANDKLKGPFHSNDSVQFSSGTQVGRQGKNDKLETNQPAPGYSGNATFYSPWVTGADKLPIPSSNSNLLTIAAAGGKVFTGRTVITINGDSATAVTSAGSTTWSLKNTNGVIYVSTAATGCSGVVSPQIADYGESAACGNVYISGTYSSSFTLASDADIIVGARPTYNSPTSVASADLVRDSSSDAVAGLISLNFVRVAHRVTRTSGQAGDPDNCTNAQSGRDETIQAAMLAVWHSFIVDNFNCGGAQVGTLKVNGAIAQNFRGRVAGTGLSNGNVSAGYLKDYTYDDRLKFRSPPYFLAPLISSWHIVKMNEQVPSR
jgi:hypothetical protein